MSNGVFNLFFHGRFVIPSLIEEICVGYELQSLVIILNYVCMFVVAVLFRAL